jgi:hypothetical protein
MKFKNGEFKYSQKRGVGRFLENKNEIKIKVKKKTLHR